MSTNSGLIWMGFKFGFFETESEEAGSGFVEGVGGCVPMRMLEHVWLDGRKGVKGEFGLVVLDEEVCAVGLEDEKVKEVVRTSDVETDVYEGGFKVWECTFDLVSFLKKMEVCEQATALELGCGHGLPLCYLIKHNKLKQAVFQDLNHDVLVQKTRPTVQSNLNPSTSTQISYVSGDWSSFLKSYPVQTFDIILSSETVYNSSNFGLLSEILLKFLAPEGKAYFSGKRHYFGVGGGISEFAHSVSSTSGLEATLVQSLQDGVSNVRDIVVVTKGDLSS